MKTRAYAAIATLLAFAGIAHGEESSKAYAKKALALWSAFECSSLAGAAGMAEEEQSRLFLFGYDQGKQFIAALQEKKILKGDLSNETPIGVLMLLQGPTPDFMLGRIFEAAQDEALKDVFGSNGNPHSKEEQKLLAGNRYRAKNCELFGAVR